MNFNRGIYLVLLVDIIYGICDDMYNNPCNSEYSSCGIEFVYGLIYGCNGNWSMGFNQASDVLCGNGYSICDGYVGVSDGVCERYVGMNYFYASMSQYPEIYGCGNSTNSEYILENHVSEYNSKLNISRIRLNDDFGWYISDTETNVIMKTKYEYGGILCCLNESAITSTEMYTSTMVMFPNIPIKLNLTYYYNESNFKEHDIQVISDILKKQIMMNVNLTIQVSSDIIQNSENNIILMEHSVKTNTNSSLIYNELSSIYSHLTDDMFYSVYNTNIISHYNNTNTIYFRSFINIEEYFKNTNDKDKPPKELPPFWKQNMVWIICVICGCSIILTCYLSYICCKTTNNSTKANNSGSPIKSISKDPQNVAPKVKKVSSKKEKQKKKNSKSSIIIKDESIPIMDENPISHYSERSNINGYSKVSNNNYNDNGYPTGLMNAFDDDNETINTENNRDESYSESNNLIPMNTIKGKKSLLKPRTQSQKLKIQDMFEEN